jgi:hypothetical protein
MNLNLLDQQSLGEFRQLQIELVDRSAVKDADYLMQQQSRIEHWIDNKIRTEVEKVLITEGKEITIFPMRGGFRFLTQTDISNLRIMTAKAMEFVALMDVQNWMRVQNDIEAWVSMRIQYWIMRKGVTFTIK